MTDDQAADINRLLTRLAEFYLLNSAEGAFELRDSVRRAGLAYGALAMRTNRLGESIVAHGVTNALLAVYVLSFDQWQLW